MKTSSIVLFTLLLSIGASESPALGQERNLGFEWFQPGTQLPQGWVTWGNREWLELDSLVRHGGMYSMRIASPETVTANDGGAAAYTIPVTFEGMRVELRGYMKVKDVQDGWAGLLLRIDRDTTILQFDNMESRRLNGTSDWQQFEVWLPLPDKATTIYVGAYLKGRGTVWVDDLQLLVDGRSISEATKRMSNKVDQDKEFDNGSGIATISLSPRTIEDLAVVGKVWGFLKYYHPAIAGGNFNWDYELFRVLGEILRVKSKDERNEVISRWIDKLGTTESGAQPALDSARVKLFPDLGWIENAEQLGRRVSKQLLEIRDAKRTGQHFYVSLVPGVSNPAFRNEKSYAAMRYPDAGYRMLSLFRYWNMIQYFFPYKHLIGEEWMEVLREFVPRFAGAGDELEYKLAVLELIARIHDTHANVRGFDKALESFNGTKFAPVRISFVQNKAVVTARLNGQFNPPTPLREGDIILSVNDQPVEEIVKSRLYRTPASNYPTQLRLIASNLLRSNDSTITVNLDRDGVTTRITVACYTPGELNLQAVSQRKDTSWKLLSKDVGYIFPGTVKNSILPEIMSAFAGTRGIVIDMRCYPSEFIVFTLGQYLMPQPTPFVKFTFGDVMRPGLFTFGPALRVGKFNSDYYRGKVVILVNETTISQAEYTTMAFSVAPNATIIGSTTSGADGNVSPITLPGGISTMISGIGVYYPDGTETQRIGIVPDIELRPTLKGIREKRDELLERAIELIQAGK